MLVAAGAWAGDPIANGPPLAGTEPLSVEGDLSVLMRAGFEKFLLRELERSIDERSKFWQRDFSSREAYERSVEPNRQRFAKAIGAVDARLPVTDLELVATLEESAIVGETPSYTVTAVRWPVFNEVYGEGLLLQPKQTPKARVVAIPDADQTPEMLAGLAPGVAASQQFARRLAECGCQVVVPVLVNRDDSWSGNPAVAMTNQTHREWIYRQAFEMGRHVIGYEVNKLRSVVDWFAGQAAKGKKDQAGIGVAGYGEGALLAFYAAALDTRIDVALVSGYYSSRQQVWDEPLYRNVFGLLREFGDAEIAGLIAPRRLVVEYSAVPAVEEPRPAGANRRAVAAPGKLQTPQFAVVQAEVERARALNWASPTEAAIDLVADADGAAIGPGSDEALRLFLHGLGAGELTTADEPTADARKTFDPAERQHRQVRQLEEYNQRLLRLSPAVREQFWNKAQPAAAADWPQATASYRDYLWDEIVGRFPPATLPPNARTRQVYDKPKWTGYEVMLDVYPDVFAWGVLLVPKDLQPGEKRPAVVCQHGLEGLPKDVIDDDPANPAVGIYESFAARLAERGFVTYAPHNFYRGGNEFRQLQRKAHPLKQTLFGLTTIQHARLLEWLGGLPFVDGQRIGFYGLSYGGNTAVRVPALLTQYAAVISSGDFNEWIHKNVTVDHPHSMIFHNVYEVFEYNLGHTFNHGDLAALIAPRPFMVERGHQDGVGRDEWVAGEYARVRRLYAMLGIPERTEIEFFNGPHKIHGVGTYEFLHKHLKWRGK